MTPSDGGFVYLAKTVTVLYNFIFQKYKGIPELKKEIIWKPISAKKHNF